ncbi:MAG: large conductance mechanosensitive channel protein MscL [Candidatus Dormibacteria bacterium]
MFQGFRNFVLRGNVVDLAIAVVIGTAFGAVVSAIVKDLLTPLIAAIVGKPDFSSLAFTINNSRFLYGDVINALISFVVIALVVYYAVVMPVNRLAQARTKPAEMTTRECPECMSSIPKAAHRCSFCTSPVTPVA